MTSDLEKTLRNVFGYAEFRANQKEVVEAVMAKRDVFFTSATGSGKSLCYQLPTCVMDGVSVVVVPTTALIEDQEAKLRSLRISVAALYDGGVHADADVYNAFLRGETSNGGERLKVILCTPEALCKNENLRDALQRLDEMNLINMIVFDEAHCIRHWGQGFRPAYDHVHNLRSEWKLSNAPIMCITASISSNDAKKTVKALGMRNVFWCKGSLKRANVSIHTLHKSSPHVHNLAEPIMTNYYEHPDEPQAIAYCTSREDCRKLFETMNTWLSARKRKLTCAVFHGQLPAKEKTAILEGFMCGTIRFLIATNAFGLGVDKPGTSSK
jgi:RecQ family ATP-dependent DNA helicase